MVTLQKADRVRDLARSGDLDQAREVLVAGRDSIPTTLAVALDETTFGGLVELSLRLAEREANNGDLATARQVLSDLRQQARARPSPRAEVWAVLYLGYTCLRQDDLDLADAYLASTIALLPQARRSQVDTHFAIPERQVVHSFATDLASAYYYQREEYVAAARTAQRAIRLDRKAPLGYYFLALSLARNNKLEASGRAWEHAIDLDPNQASFQMNYASVLFALGRSDAALGHMNSALQLDPNNTRYLMSRAQLYGTRQQYADAIADLTRVVDLNEQQSVDEAPAPAATTRAEYERTMSARDVADVARMTRVQTYLAWGRRTEALGDLAYMIEHGDEATRWGALIQRGDVRAADKQSELALADYTAAIELLPNAADAYLKRSDAYVALGRFGDAITDLAFTAHREREPEASIDRLTRILEAQPQLALAHKWRGFANFEAWRPSRADPDFTQALESLREDADLYLWRGLARITNSPLPDEAAWNKALTLGGRAVTRAGVH